MSEKKKMYDYYGYKVDATTGDVYSKKEPLMTLTPCGGKIAIYIDGKMKRLDNARIVYEAVTKERLSASVVMKRKDGNYENCAFDNILIVSRKEHLKNNNYSSLYALSREEVAEIKAKYDIETRRKLGAKGKNMHPSYNELAREYGVSKSTIVKVIKGNYVYDLEEKAKNEN